MKDKKSPSWIRSITLGLAVVFGILVYAYAFESTDMSFEETRNPQRQISLQRVLRAMAHPDILTYEKEEFTVSHPIWISCPETPLVVPEPDTSLPYIILDPPCADPEDEIIVEGFNFEPNTLGPINMIPPSGVSLQLGNVSVDSSGHFLVTVELPRRQPVDEAQEIRVITRRNVGLPKFTKTAYDTWDKIVETVFMALLATTFGTILAVPISFFAARNLMKDVTSPLSSAAMTLLFWPIGVFIGGELVQWLSNFSTLLTGTVMMNVGGVVVAPVIAWGAFRWAIPPEDQRATLAVRSARTAILLVAIFLGVLSLRLFANLAFTVGKLWAEPFGAFGFVATFISNLGEIAGLLVTVTVVLATGGFVGSLGGRIGQTLYERLPSATVKLLNFPLGAASGAVLGAILGATADWFYQFENLAVSLWWPAGVGAVLGLLVAAKAWQEDVLTTGLTIYTVTRTLLNALRSIEALIMVIVFAVWVSIGPFAGVLALSLHTVASLAKLYS